VRRIEDREVRPRRFMVTVGGEGVIQDGVKLKLSITR